MHAHARQQPQRNRPRQVHNPARQQNMSTGGKVALAIAGLVIVPSILIVAVPLIVIAVAAKRADERFPTDPYAPTPTPTPWPTQPEL